MPYIAVNRSTGKLYSYSPLHTLNTDDFLFSSIDEFIECMLEDDTDHIDDYLLVEVNKMYKPNVDFEEITDGEIY